MTDTLLIIIAVLLAVRIVLQVRQGKRAFEKMYCAQSEVEYNFDICNNAPFVVAEYAKKHGKDNWELITILPIDVSGNACYALFFTRKKIKNFLEE